ncbi:sulfurtransferase [Neobacillus sp. D3-1R]|uniref:sulfurtransferase n=1 Tax=Neobacillus sp. D3-1R TaxID=3445778 RepID=UPI003FA0A424
MKNIVDKEWLKKELENTNLVILDCRFSLAEPESGFQAYQTSHIPGAIYCHLEKDISGPIQEHGGRHPLPDLNSFKLYLENAGVSNNTVVVAYDNGEGAFASRLWWVMKFMGHDKVYVLNGGWKEWEAEGYPIENALTSPEKKGNYQINLQPSMLATYEDVKKSVNNQQEKVVLIDSREPKRYLGIEEPIDKVAGRIPGAINKFWNEGFENGRFKQLDDQRDRFSDVNHKDPVVVYCGSGVTAVPNYLILHELGFQNLKLYIGSYSDWISYDLNSIEKN